ncbi:MAG: hypothetical protein NW205_10520 [Hyphomicrobiaceae bacterium]|nr:hypothetical protein [Hyphomicrobiaceae bacterium]
MAVLKVINLDRTKPESTFLLRSARNVYSQTGEDGILERLFELVGCENKWCVEFGAWDGIHLSNTCHLIRDKGWNALLIEGNAEKANELKANFADNPKVVAMNSIVGFTEGIDTLDVHLSRASLPADFDFLSIDVDGNDHHIWESMRDYRPRVVCVEYNPMIPNDVVFIQDRDMRVNQGSSLAALIELGRSKGYELVCATRFNGIFVQSELFARVGIADNSIDAMRANVTGRIFGTYDGTLYNHTGRLTNQGQGLQPERRQFQILSRHQRRFGDSLNGGGGLHAIASSILGRRG